MSLAFYFDHHVPSAVARGLRSRGIDVLTTQEDGTAESDDEAILKRATELDRVVYTQDDDFLVIASHWQETGREFAGIVYAEQIGITIGRAVLDLEIIAGATDPDEMRNHIEYLPL